MAKRMTVTLVATMVIVAALGFVKFKQVQTAIGQAARQGELVRALHRHERRREFVPRPLERQDRQRDERRPHHRQR